MTMDALPEEAEWRRYFEATREGAAHRLFDLLEPHLPAAGTALDLGCGTGRGALRLLAAGLEVTAVDINPEALAIVRDKAPADAPLRLVRSSFEDFRPDRTYDVVVGCCALFFMTPENHVRQWPVVADAVAAGGVWAGHFLGPRDDWHARNFATHDRNEVDRLLGGFEVLYLEEDERDGTTALGEPKHWHLFHTVARRR